MADLRDEKGNPIQLTDQHGNPVQLTDEHGNPMHLTGVATSTPGTGIHTPTTGVTTTHDPTKTGSTPGTGIHAPGTGTEPRGIDVPGTGTKSRTPGIGHGEHGMKMGEKAGVGGVSSGATIGGVMAGHETHGGGVTKTTESRVPEHGHGEIRRSGSSSSSSSSEDDGQGGRRKKKGLKEKIKEKLGGGKHKDEQPHTAGTTHVTEATTVTSTTTTAGTGKHTEPEKKGMMEKIKEKMPGYHSH